MPEGTPLPDLLILVVAYDSTVALDTERHLRGLGCNRVLTTPRVWAALRILDESKVDAAVVQGDLDEVASSVVERLSADCVPFVIVGDLDPRQTERMLTVPRVPVPVKEDKLRRAIAEALATPPKPKQIPNGEPRYEPEWAMKWRARASDLRRRAAATADPTIRNDLLSLAQELERKAAVAVLPPWLRNDRD